MEIAEQKTQATNLKMNLNRLRIESKVMNEPTISRDTVVQNTSTVCTGYSDHAAFKWKLWEKRKDSGNELEGGMESNIL